MNAKSGSTFFVLWLVACAAFAANTPATLNNDDSCDIIVTPAATLLLPYFEVNLASPFGETTLFTVTNVTQSPRSRASRSGRTDRFRC